MNLCVTCGEDFGSTRAFDAHRVGRYPQKGPSEYTGHIEDWSPEKGRRCLDGEEMLEKGFLRNEGGAWSIGSDLERARLLRANTERIGAPEREAA